MDPFPRQQRLAALRQKLAALTTELVKTEEELTTLEADGQLNLGAPPAAAVQIPRTPAEKVSLFLDLFGSRRSVYPKRWENHKAGKSGYSPACNNDSFANRQSGICRKPKVKCSECPHQRFPPLDERAVESHLRGEQTLGVYAIGTDDNCRFLAAFSRPTLMGKVGAMTCWPTARRPSASESRSPSSVHDRETADTVGYSSLRQCLLPRREGWE